MSYMEIIYLGYGVNTLCFLISLTISVISLFVFTDKLAFLNKQVELKEVYTLLPKSEKLKGIFSMFLPFSYIFISVPYLLKLSYCKFNLAIYAEKEITTLVNKYDLNVTTEGELNY
jgi:hypothetical protein